MPKVQEVWYCSISIEPIFTYFISHIGFLSYSAASNCGTLVNDNGSYTIGAAVAGAVLDEEEDFGNNWPGVLEALRLIGSEQITYTGKTSTTLTGATRGANSTSAASHSDGAAVGST